MDNTIVLTNLANSHICFSACKVRAVEHMWSSTVVWHLPGTHLKQVGVVPDHKISCIATSTLLIVLLLCPQVSPVLIMSCFPFRLI